MPFYPRHDWSKEKEKLQELANEGASLVTIGELYGVTRERMRQVFRMLGLTNGVEIKRQRRQADHYRRVGDRAQDDYAAKREKYSNKKANAKRLNIPFTIEFGEIEWPEYCPVLGLKLDYYANGRQENSPSIDQIDPNQGYILGNVAVISWRANRIKNDGTLDEHVKIVTWLSNVLKSK